MIIIWVDDGLVCGNNQEIVKQVIEYLRKHFAMRSSSADHFLGTSITRAREQKMLYISQPDYIKNHTSIPHEQLFSKENPNPS